MFIVHSYAELLQMSFTLKMPTLIYELKAFEEYFFIVTLFLHYTFLY